MENCKTLHKNQITISDALKLIDLIKVESFDIYYRVLNNGIKQNIYYSETFDNYIDEEVSIREFIKQADNYGSIWLVVRYYVGEPELYQLVDDETMEIL